MSTAEKSLTSTSRTRCRARDSRVRFVAPEINGSLEAGALGEIPAALPRVLIGMCSRRVLTPARAAFRAGRDRIAIVWHVGRAPPTRVWGSARNGDPA